MNRTVVLDNKFRKKPVVVEAMRWTGDYTALENLLGLNWGRADAHCVHWGHEDGEEVVIWNSAEKVWLPLPLEHWVIRGVHGEFYPCAADIFAKTYEPVICECDRLGLPEDEECVYGETMCGSREPK